MKVTTIILLLFVFGFGVPAIAETVYVEDVIAGDTLILDSGETLKLVGLDAPESRANDKARLLAERRNIDLSSITVAGRKALMFTSRLIKEKYVRVEYDSAMYDSRGHLQAYVYLPVCSWRGRQPNCKYDKVPGYMYVDLKKTDREYGTYVFVNATLILSGYATPLSLPPNTKYTEEFKDLFQIAQKNKMGLWR